MNAGTNSIMRDLEWKVVTNACRLQAFRHVTREGSWQTTSNAYWTGGFWTGLLWLCYQLRHDDKYLRWAYSWLKRLEKRRWDKTFDLGFVFYPSFALGYQITRDQDLKKIALEAADTLSGLFDQKARFIHDEIDFEGSRIGRTLIDVMMNLLLLRWAYQETSHCKYCQPAYQHCLSTIAQLLRNDYSTIHVLDFDLDTGETIRKGTIQGYSHHSCWSRGQAWAIYGFTLALETCQDKGFLEIAEGLADYLIKKLPDDYVPYRDFNDPEIPNTVRDSSAAAIACSGLLRLSELTCKEKFKETAFKMLNSLTNDYLAHEDCEGILKHGCFHKPANLGVDESTIWGDYYFVEALTKAKVPL